MQLYLIDCVQVENSEKIKRYRRLAKISEWTEIPLIFLGFLWLVLLVVELIWQLTPFLMTLVNVIWVIFILDFLIKLIVAPARWKFLRRNTLTIISLFIPAFRIFRIFASLRLLRSLGVIRSIRVIRVVGSVNRGMRVLDKTLERRAFGYVLILTLLIALVAAAAMFAFEKAGTFDSYLDALYWTAMMITTMGSGYWPASPEGKTLALLLSVYSLGVLGYFTAMLSSFFIGRDADNEQAEVAGTRQLDEIAAELKALREEMKKRKQ